MTSKALILVALIPVLSAPLLTRGGGEVSRVQEAQQPQQKQPDKATQLMRNKLEHAQKILEGIALADLDVVRKHADELLELTKRLEWRAVKTPQYEVQTNQYRRALEEINKAAHDKNLDAAALGYVDMTLSCVRCHKYVREVRWVRRD